MARNNYITFLGDTQLGSNEGDNSLYIPYPGKPVKVGSLGNNVLDVQNKLIALGYIISAEEKSVFGIETENIIRTYQGQNRLTVTGVVDQITWEKLFGRAPKTIPDSQRTATLGDQVLSATASYTMDGSSQVTISYLDPGYKMMAAGHFSLRRKLNHRGLAFEIASVETQQSSGGSPMVTIEARAAAIQAMKRDKKPEVWRNISASDFAKQIAGRFGMGAFVQRTQKVQTIVKAKNPQSDESTWTVLTRLANDEQFVCFESGNTLFFCSQQYLLGKLGNYSLRWPPVNTYSGGTVITNREGLPFPERTIQRGSLGNDVLDIQNKLADLGFVVTAEERGTFGVETENNIRIYQGQNRLTPSGSVDKATWESLFGRAPRPIGGDRPVLIGTPRMRRSDDESLEATGSASVDRVYGVKMRAGHTVRVSGVPGFNGAYLITEVRFEDNSPEPVEIFFRTPQKPQAK